MSALASRWGTGNADEFGMPLKVTTCREFRTAFIHKGPQRFAVGDAECAARLAVEVLSVPTFRSLGELDCHVGSLAPTPIGAVPIA